MWFLLFYSYEEYEERFLRPILTDVEALREILRKHKIGELTEQEANERAAKYLSRKEQAEQTRQAVEAALAENTDATHQQIAKEIGITRQRVSQIANEMQASSEHKLLNHGVNQHSGVAYRQVQDKGSNKADYILARLERDGHSNLFLKAKNGELSARQAGILAGFVHQESQLTVLKRAWRKANESERQSFKQFIEEK